MLKSGTTKSGQVAAASHTGSLAGDDAAYSAALSRAGVWRAESLEELCDAAIICAHAPALKGERVAIVTNAGGPGILASDQVDRVGLELAPLTETTKAALKKTLPSAAATHNPIDALGDADSHRYDQALEIVLADSTVDAVVVLLTPQAMTEIEKTAQVIEVHARRSTKPIVCSFIGEELVKPGQEFLSKKGIPHFPYPERAVSALALWHRIWQHQQPRPKAAPRQSHAKAVSELLPPTLDLKTRRKLDFKSTQRLVELYRFPQPPTELVTSAQAASAAARKMGLPVVMKIESPDIIHKTEFKGVKVGLETLSAVEESFGELMKNAQKHAPDAELEGCLVQQQIEGAVELFIGMHRDPTFGPLVTFGLGGVYVEALKDISVRLAPLTEADAREMIHEIRAHEIIEGTRGLKGVDRQKLIRLLLAVSQLAEDAPQVKEIDLNPVLATPEEVWAADVRIII